MYQKCVLFVAEKYSVMWMYPGFNYLLRTTVGVSDLVLLQIKLL